MSATPIPSLTLNDGHTIPRLGFGGDQIPPGQTQAAVTIALEAGYRHVDTAAAYRNEATGAASGAVKLTLSGIPARLVNCRQSPPNKPGPGYMAACPETGRRQMEVAGIRRVGAPVELIEVGEPRPLARDEVLVEVRAAGVANWDEFVRTGGWDVVPARRWRWAWRQPARCWQRARRPAIGRPATRS